MRRLTLILSDLYLPADAIRESFPGTLELPALQWLLRFARPPRRVSGWRGWLARELGAGAIADWPVAHVVALSADLPVDGAWMGTPVALEARLDHVRLRDRGLLRLPLDQQQALQAEFARTFGDSLSLQAGGQPALLLRGGPRVDITTQDPARLLDSDIGEALPKGSGAAGELRRLGAEIEMWLHASPLNELRERAGQRRISSLWFWGGGHARASVPAAHWKAREFHLSGTDNFIRAMQELAGSESRPVPPDFSACPLEKAAFVELAPMSGAVDESLAELERRWFAPAQVALSSGSLQLLQIVANDRVFELGARAGWRFWRRRRGWLESLA